MYARRVTSFAMRDSMGCGAQRFRRAQFAVHRGTAGNGAGATHDWPPSYNAIRSSVPWNAIIGTARRSLHQLHGSVCAAPTMPTAAMRPDSMHDRTKAKAPPLEEPV